MFSNYLKLAWRNLLKRKGYSLINIAGLALGLAICMLIVLFVRHETGYDDFLKNKDDIYRMVVDRKYPGRSTSYSIIPQSYAQAVKSECPEVKAVVRIFDFLGGTAAQYRYQEKVFSEKRVLRVDSTFFDVFDHRAIAGDLHAALFGPHTAVMTESTAIRFFGSVEAAIGKSITPDGQLPDPIKITAVCADWPENSHFEFDLLESTVGQEQFQQENYVNFAAHTYLLLHDQAKVADLENKFPSIIKKYAAGNIAAQFAMPYDAFFAAGNGYHYFLQPLQKIHLISHLEGELKPNGSQQAVYIFGMIAIIILFLAIINFINLSTARSGERAREVGIRKTFGSDKKILILQFLTESILISVCSLILAIGLVYLLLPFFLQFTGAELHFSALLRPANLLVFILLTVVTGLSAGIYPAFILSSFKPIAVLKGKFNSTGYGMALRNGMVIFQFAISVILIICTLIVNQQMGYMTGNDLGYDKDLTLILKRTDLLGDRSKTFKEALKSLPGVANVSGASAFPGDDNYFGISWRKPGDQQPMTGRGIIADDQYQKTFGLELKEGRYFSREYGTDSLSIVLNESAVKELNLTQPIGKNLISDEQFLNGQGGQTYLYQIIGVVKDYNYQSLHLPITPLVFTNTSRFNEVTFSQAVKLKPGNLQASLHAITQKWSEFVNDRSLDYEFLDQTIARQYAAELRTQKIFTFFSTLAILIACMGLFGLAAYTCQQRMKEISVRKVLGASNMGIVTLLTKSFLQSILISFMISFPIAWYVMHRWLQDFAYRIDIHWELFGLAGGIALLIALTTLSVQTVRASMANPIRTLRSE